MSIPAETVVMECVRTRIQGDRDEAAVMILTIVG